MKQEKNTSQASDCALLDELVISWVLEGNTPESCARRIAARMHLENRLRELREQLQDLADKNT